MRMGVHINFVSKRASSYFYRCRCDRKLNTSRYLASFYCTLAVQDYSKVRRNNLLFISSLNYFLTLPSKLNLQIMQAMICFLAFPHYGTDLKNKEGLSTQTIGSCPSIYFSEL